MAATLTGDRRVNRTLSKLADKIATKVSRKAVNQGMTVISKAVKKEAPDKKTKKSIGKRYKKRRKPGVIEAKVGINVGKKLAKQIPHAHLTALGTSQRKTKAGKNRGRIAGSDFVSRGYAASKADAANKIKQEVIAGIAKEAKA